MDFITFIFVSLVFIGFGIVLGFFSPQKKIWWYGYRTPQSMKSDASYALANTISGRILILLGLLIFIASVTLEIYFIGMIMIAGFVFLFAYTEWKLYQFHKKGD